MFHACITMGWKSIDTGRQLSCPFCSFKSYLIVFLFVSCKHDYALRPGSFS